MRYDSAVADAEVCAETLLARPIANVKDRKIVRLNFPLDISHFPIVQEQKVMRTETCDNSSLLPSRRPVK